MHYESKAYLITLMKTFLVRLKNGSESELMSDRSAEDIRENAESLKRFSDWLGEREIDLRVPEMIDYIRICAKYGKVGVLEFKGMYNEEQMKEIVEIIKAEYSLDNMIFISFAFENLLTLRKVCPESHCQFLTGEYKQEILDMLVEHKMGLDIWSNAIPDEEKVKHILEMGIELNVWTVDSKELAEQLISWGVQYITSNILE